jgi:hypothetical protein
LAAPAVSTAQTEPPGARRRSPDLAETADRRSPETDTLIERLADDSFAARNEAYDKLLDRGEAALPALRRAARSQVLEIRCQAERLLGEIGASLYRQRITRFLEGDRSVTLPGWPPFRKLCGDDDASRKMFVEMTRAEPALWQCCTGGADRIAQAVNGRCEQIKTESNYRRRRRGPWPTVCSLLLCAAREDAEIDYQDQFVVYNLASHGSLDDLLEEDARGVKVRRLMSHWISHGTDQSAILRFQLGYHFKLKASFAPALQLLRSGREKYIHHKAMLVVAAYGTRENLPDVAPYLDDDTILFKRSDTGYTCQSRDAALLASLHLLGRDPVDFGFTHLQANSFHLYQYNSIGFADPKTRTTAFTAWRKLRSNESFNGKPKASANR